MNLKTAFLTLSISRRAGGLFNSVRRLAQQLAKAEGTAVEVLSLRDENSEDDLPEWLPIKPQVFPRSGPAAFGYAPGLFPSLQKMNCDLVRVDGLWTYPSVACLKWFRQTRRPYLVAPRGMLDAWALHNSRWKKRLAGLVFEREHLKSATCLHALAESEAKSIRAFGLKNPIGIIPNGIDLPPSIENSESQLSSSALQPFRDGRKVLLYLGRIHPKKGLVHLLRAWKAALQDQPRNSWALAIAGWDQDGHQEELRKLSEDYGIEDSVYFLGPQFGPDKAACYRNCAAFVLPSLSEGLPMVVLEAWSYARPVLMTPECNLPEGFAAQAALRIEPNVDSITRGLRDLFEMSDSQRQTLGQQGLSLVTNHFSWPKVAAQVQGVHEWMLGGGPRPACMDII